MSQRTVFQLLNKAASDFPNRSYLSTKINNKWASTSFLEAKRKAQTLASAFMEIGIQAEDKIAILSEAKTDWIISELAALYVGAISVPLSVKLLPEEIPFRINHSESQLIIGSENTLERLISQRNNYHNPQVKFLILDTPSDRIKEICAKQQFDESELLYIDELYQLGASTFPKNEGQIQETEQNTNENQVVTISYTSGTTGNPKGIMLTHLNYHSNSLEAVNTFKIKAFISSLIILPIDHSFAHTIGIYTAMVQGLSLYFVDAKGGAMKALKNIPINLKETNPDFLLTVPALTGNFINKIKEGIAAKGGFAEQLFNMGLKAAILRNGDTYHKTSWWTRLKTFFIYQLAEHIIFKKLRLIFGKNIQFCVGGGALLDVKQQQFYKAIGIPVYQGYGLTEAAPIISSNTPFYHKIGTSGKVLGNIKCKICDDNGQELPKGEKGEIVIQGDNVMKGYYKNPEASAETLKDNWLHTGDLGYMDEDDFLVVVGREKALLISEDGEKYSPEEIEEAIVNSSPYINQAMIYNDHKKHTTALITLNKERFKKLIKKDKLSSHQEMIRRTSIEINRFKLQKEFKGKFPEKWTPSYFQLVEDDFSEQNKMINSTMKMVRHKITENYKDKIDLMYQQGANERALSENIRTYAKVFELE